MNFLPMRWPGVASTNAESLAVRACGCAALLMLALLWSYWTTLAAMADRWAHDPQYAHGFLVPVFALVVLWSRRDRLLTMTWKPALVGLPLVFLGIGLRLFAIRRDLEPLDAFALLPTLFGLVLLTGGRSVFSWCWPAVAFLAFMIPLPYFVETALAYPLRRLATIISAYALETFGYPALAEGNIIFIDQLKLGVAEACSGLGMLSTFVALATALALITTSPLADRLIVVVSAVPIALIANVARITATGMAYHGFGSAAAQVVMHDVSGWLMMPLALLLLALELRFLSKLFGKPWEVRDEPVRFSR